MSVRLGIDLGTTRTIVAASDRGNYPIVGFSAPNGDVVEHFPTISAEHGGQLVHGLEAVQAAREGAPYLRSWKRLLAQHAPSHQVQIGEQQLSLLELTADFLGALARVLMTGSNLPGPPTELPEVVVSVPANAHSSQRFTTLEAFRRAGFTVRAMLNEPSAAAIEYANRYRGSINSKRECVAVYDLGGGTFDAALVRIAGAHHDVVGSAGMQQLGGDDFDQVLLDLVLERAGVDSAAIEPCAQQLLRECCAAKESLGPSTRRIVLDLAALEEGAPAEPVVLEVKEYYERLRPLVAQTVRALGQVMGGGEAAQPLELSAIASRAGVAGIYVVGGASGLPLIPRLLREYLPRRVHRSTYPSAATAMGLAIAADEALAPQLRERFTRHLGVFREADDGATISFDSIFAPGTPMPESGAPPLVVTRRYRAKHNVGHYRFVECAELSSEYQPQGDISPHGTALFPFAPPVRDCALDGVRIERLPTDGPTIEERYEVDAAGVVAITIRDVHDGYERRYVL